MVVVVVVARAAAAVGTLTTKRGGWFDEHAPASFSPKTAVA